MNIEFATEVYRNVTYFMQHRAPRNIFGDPQKREKYQQDEAVAHFTQEWAAGLKQTVYKCTFLYNRRCRPDA